MLGIIMLSVNKMRIVILSAIMLHVVILCVVLPIVMAPLHRHHLVNDVLVFNLCPSVRPSVRPFVCGVGLIKDRLELQRDHTRHCITPIMKSEMSNESSSQSYKSFLSYAKLVRLSLGNFFRQILDF